MNNKIPIIIAKTITLVVALGVMFSLVVDAHEEQKEQKQLTDINDPYKSVPLNINSNKEENRSSRVFFQSSKIISKSVVRDSTVGMKIDVKENKRKDENIGAVMQTAIGIEMDNNETKTEDENRSK
jgi:hypothetical protein